MWRDQGAREEIVELVPGTCLTIPVGTRFQFQSDDQNLEAVAVTIPPWPGGGAVVVDGLWPAMVGSMPRLPSASS